jgi:sugar phosphate isomerase/epimerase
MSKFIISCCTCSLRGYANNEVKSTFEHAPSAGYWAWGMAYPPLFKTLGSQYWFNTEGLKQEALAAGLIHCSEVYAPNLPNYPVRIEDIRDITGIFEIARILESPLVVMTAKKKDDNNPAGLDYCVEFLRELTKRITIYKNIRLVLEPHYNHQLGSLEDFRYIFQRISAPQIGITVDTGHMHSAKIDIPAFIHEFGGRIYNVHVKDHVGTQSVPIGTGEINLAAIVKALDGIGYEGALGIEIESPDHENLPRYIKDAYVYMRRIVKDVTGQEC